MNKELNYLSLPDHFNKFILTNFNQKINLKKSILLEFKFSNKSHLGSALKSIYFLETVFPKKSFVFKIKIKKKKKVYFGQKSKNAIFFSFNLGLSYIQFIDFFRFFSLRPLKFNQPKIEEVLLINKKLKQFEFDKKILFKLGTSDVSLNTLIYYHLN